MPIKKPLTFKKPTSTLTSIIIGTHVLVIQVHVGKNLVDVVLLDGGYQVTIITKDLKNKLGLPILRSAPYTLVMVDQTLPKLVGLIKNLQIHIH